MLNRTVNDKIHRKLDDIFASAAPSQELFDLKEELAANIRDKVTENRQDGMEEDKAIKEAFIAMGDLSDLVEDMRRQGKNTVRKAAYSSMTLRISNAGIIASVVLILFGAFNMTMLTFMNVPRVAVSGSSIFAVIGGALLTYSLLTRETKKRYAMNKVRAMLYALAVGLVLFSFQVSADAGFATGRVFPAVGSMMIFFIAGAALWLALMLTGRSRKKEQ